MLWRRRRKALTYDTIHYLIISGLHYKHVTVVIYSRNYNDLHHSLSLASSVVITIVRYAANLNVPYYDTRSVTMYIVQATGITPIKPFFNPANSVTLS
jgi:hypothetical protein